MGVGLSFVPAFGSRSRGYRRAYRQGRAGADAQWKAGRVCLYTYGLRGIGDNLDPETGLACEGIAGCEVDDAILGRAAGHDERVAELIEQKGLPPGSFKPRLAELSGLAAYFRSRTGEDAPRGMDAEGPGLRSADGRHVVRLVTDIYERGDGGVGRTLSLALDEGKNASPKRCILLGDCEPQLVWGPSGSGFVVVRGRSEGFDIYEAIDLNRGRSLKLELVKRPERSSHRGREDGVPPDEVLPPPDDHTRLETSPAPAGSVVADLLFSGGPQ